MAVTITPSYDFSVNEIPRKETLQAMASGLSITGIPLTQIATTLIAISINDTTGPSNLVGEGWMWFDARGSLWGRTRDGDVRVKRHEGGWESNRFRSVGNPGAAGDPLEPGKPGRMHVLTANATNITEAVVASNAVRSDDGTQLAPFVAQETAPSQPLDGGAQVRWCGRGMTRMFTFASAQGSGLQQARLKWNPSIGGQHWILEDMFANSTNIQAESAELAENTSPTECRAYFLGYPCRDRG